MDLQWLHRDINLTLSGMDELIQNTTALKMGFVRSIPSHFRGRDKSMEMVIPDVSIDLSKISLFYSLRMSL